MSTVPPLTLLAMLSDSGLIPLRDFLKNYDFDAEAFEEAIADPEDFGSFFLKNFETALLGYIVEGSLIPDLHAHPEQLMIVEDCKRFYFILTGEWPTFK